MSYVSLRHLEKLTGIRAHTFRTWEQRYTLLKNLRGSDGWRMYTTDQTRLLLNITLLNQAGFRISDIAKMPAGHIMELAAALATDSLKQQKAIHALFLHMLALEPESFEMVLDSCVQYWGVPKTLTAVLVPFLEKTALLYPTVTTTAENLVRNLIRHKLIAGIEQLPAPAGQSERALLFLPQKQHHELALLYMYYLLKQQGATVLYLGANVPLEQLKTVLASNSFKALYTCCSKQEPDAETHAAGDYLEKHAPHSKLLVLNTTGHAATVHTTSNIVIFNSVHAAPHLMAAPVAEPVNHNPVFVALKDQKMPEFSQQAGTPGFNGMGF